MIRQKRVNKAGLTVVMNRNIKNHRQVSRMFEAPIQNRVFRSFNGWLVKPKFYQNAYRKNIYSKILRDYKELVVMSMLVNNI